MWCRRRLTSRKRWSGPWHHKRKDGTIVEVEVLSTDLDFNGRSAASPTART